MVASVRFHSAALVAGLMVISLGAGAAQAAGGTTFDPSAPATIVESYSALNLATNPYFQVGIVSTATGLNISNLGYSYDGSTYTNFSPSSFSTTTSYQYTAVVNKGSAVGIPFYVRYTIAPGASLGEVVQTSLLTNSENSQTAGVLSSTINNNYTSVDRFVTAATPVPGPLSLAGAGAAFAFSRRLRRRIRPRG